MVGYRLVLAWLLGSCPQGRYFLSVASHTSPSVPVSV